MKAQRFPLSRAVIPAVKNQYHASAAAHPDLHPDLSPLKSRRAETITKLLDRRWSLVSPDPKIHQIVVSQRRQSQPGPLGNFDFSNNACPGSGGAATNAMMVRNNGSSSSSPSSSSFYAVRDDLLHPLVNGNKARKLDGLLPLIEDHSVTDVVTCGGCQSAHAAAVAFSCGERGLRSHLLLRGERPEILTGYNLISTVYGNVTYVPRSVYADREKMLMEHADMVAAGTGSILSFDDILKASFTPLLPEMPNFVQMDTHRSHENFSKRVVIVNEGASSALALLGVIRLVHYLSHNHSLGKERPVKLVVDAGTGTTAVGLGLGAICLGLPWEVIAVTLADTIDGYKKQEKCLISEFKRLCASHLIDHDLHGIDGGTVHWMERSSPRKFGNILEGELEACQHVARQTGVLVDPVYTLAAWELATHMSREESRDGANVVMLHTGGTLGMFGLAQRYKPYFHAL